MGDLSTDQAAYFNALLARWGGRSEAFERLPATVARKRRCKEGVAGWRTNLPTDYLGKDRRLELVVPFDPKSVVAELYVTPNPFLDWPHVEVDGRLCLWPPGRAPVWLPMQALAEATIERLKWLFRLVDPAASTEHRHNEFAREWTSYWVMRRNPGQRGAGRLILIDVPASPLALMTASFASPGAHEKLVIVGHDLEATQQWVQQSAFAPLDAAPTKVLVVELHSAPSVPGAPESPDAISNFIETWAAEPGLALPAFNSLVHEVKESAGWVVFHHGSDALTALQLTPRFNSVFAHSSANARERRHAKAQRRLARISVAVMAVDRVDPQWIYERGRSPAASTLSRCHVVAVGCGSLGSQVIDGLALSGVGTITLVDPDVFEGANIGRHTLGVGAIGEYKVDAVRKRLVADYPHLQVDVYPTTAQDADCALTKTLATADLVICTTADPASERYMVSQIGDGVRALLLAWAEPHAMAGHSIWLDRGSVPIDSLFERGRYKFPAIRWSTEQAEALPGCGTSHLPGAGNRVRWIASQVVEHSIDGLTAQAAFDQQRAFVESSDAIAAIGGQRIRPSSSGPGVVLVMKTPAPIEGSEGQRVPGP